MRLTLRYLGLLIALLCGGCNNSEPSIDDARKLLVALSNGDTPTDFSGSKGTAIEKLVTAQKSQESPIIFDVIDGDAPAPIGDSSCNYHAFASLDKDDEPFLGIRLKYEKQGWHIAGYWTP